VCVGDDPPDESKEGPREHEAGGEDEQRPAPLGVNQGGEDVLEKEKKMFKVNNDCCKLQLKACKR